MRCKKHRGIAQLVEYRSPKPWVVGSSPSAPAINKTDGFVPSVLFIVVVEAARNRITRLAELKVLSPSAPATKPSHMRRLFFVAGAEGARTHTHSLQSKLCKSSSPINFRSLATEIYPLPLITPIGDLFVLAEPEEARNHITQRTALS